MPFLSLLIFLPLAAALLLLAVEQPRAASRIAFGAALLELALALWMLSQFQANADGMQMVERHAWIPSLKIQYLLGVDGVSVLFLPLAAMLSACVILSSWNQSLPKLYYSLLLALEGVTMGVFTALDLALFFLFWELTLPPLYFLISLWGIGPQRRHAALQYTLFMLAGGALLLLGLVLLALNHADEYGLPIPAGLSFDYMDLLETPASLEAQKVIFLLLFFGFAVKAPLFPLHVWLPAAAMEGPAGVAALLLGLKLGAFGLLRFAIPLAPQAAQHYSSLMAALGVIGALYAALLALRQTNLRRMLAFSSISHVGVLLIGLASLNLQGVQGAWLQLSNFSVLAGGAFLIAGFVQRRIGSTELANLGGAARAMPVLAFSFLALGFAALGAPGGVGFPAEHLIAIGALQAHIGMGLAVLLSALLGAAYFLGFFQRAFFGPLERPELAQASDLRPREWLIVALLLGLALAGGIFPQALLQFSHKPLQAWVKRLEAGDAGALANRADAADAYVYK